MKALIQEWPPELAAKYREKGYWRGETMLGMLQERAERFGDLTAVVDGERRWTYRELHERSLRVAAGLLRLGLQAGERVIIQLPNIAEFFSVTFGCIRAGLVPVFTLPAHRITELTHFAEQAEASAHVIPALHEGFDYRNLATDLQQRAPGIRHVIVVGDAGSFVALDDVSSADPTGIRFHEAEPSEVFMMQLSGGSTGLSKLIPRTHDDYIYSFRASAEICGMDSSSVYLGVLPIAHNFPMSSPGTFGAFYVGATVVLCPSPSPEVAFPLIEKERVTITGVVPPLALIWLDAANNTTYDLSSLKLFQVGGAKFTPAVAQRVRPTMGTTLQQVFGMAEGLVNYTHLDDPEDRIVNTQGCPISEDDEVLIVDDNGNPVPDGTPGHLLTRGPYTIRGYHNAPEANARAFTAEGYYRTGDVVMRTPEGYLVVMGRSTDQINRGGEKVSAEEVEDHLLSHPQVHDAALVAVPDEYLGERSCAFVIPRGDIGRESKFKASLKAWVRERGLAAYKVPDQIVLVESFPSTGVGKISRRELRQALREQLAVQEGN